MASPFVAALNSDNPDAMAKLQACQSKFRQRVEGIWKDVKQPQFTFIKDSKDNLVYLVAREPNGLLIPIAGTSIAEFTPSWALEWYAMLTQDATTSKCLRAPNLPSNMRSVYCPPGAERFQG